MSVRTKSIATRLRELADRAQGVLLEEPVNGHPAAPLRYSHWLLNTITHLWYGKTAYRRIYMRECVNFWFQYSHEVPDHVTADHLCATAQKYFPLGPGYVVMQFDSRMGLSQALRLRRIVYALEAMPDDILGLIGQYDISLSLLLCSHGYDRGVTHADVFDALQQTDDYDQAKRHQVQAIRTAIFSARMQWPLPECELNDFSYQFHRSTPAPTESVRKRQKV